VCVCVCVCVENRLIFGEVMDSSLVSCCLTHGVVALRSRSGFVDVRRL